jgi:PAS domain S-box-containing protein
MDSTPLIPILVVDDDPAIVKIFVQVLQQEGYRPWACVHPDEALALLETENFPLAFIDINLPVMNGLELGARIKAGNQACEVIFITGFGTFENAIQAIQIGAYGYLRKPFSIGEIKLWLQKFRRRQALKEEVRLAEERYTHLVQNIPLLIFILRRDLNLDYINSACQEMLGYSPEEIRGHPGWLLERVDSGDRERVRSAFQGAFESDTPVSLECRLLHRDGHHLHAMARLFPLTVGDLGRSPDCLQGVLVDMTERVFLEKVLVQNEKLKTLGAISAEVAHEIRNPLVGIGGFARRLQKKHPDLEECGIILKESQRLENILSRILNYLKPVEMKPQYCSVKVLLSYCLDLMSPEAERKPVKTILDLESDLADVYADRGILIQVFINLIRQAHESAGKEGIVTIRAFQDDRGVVIAFAVEAGGETIKNQETLFMPFAEGGQGIGLPLCHRLVKESGGFLSFTQEGEKQVFTVLLPKRSGLGSGQQEEGPPRFGRPETAEEKNI